MGIVVLFFLRFNGDPAMFTKELVATFPCCVQPREDLRRALHFWEDLRRIVDEIAEPLCAQELAQDMMTASSLLGQQQQRLSIFPDRGPPHGNRGPVRGR